MAPCVVLLFKNVVKWDPRRVQALGDKISELYSFIQFNGATLTVILYYDEQNNVQIMYNIIYIVKEDQL